jgi:hypothetical protein
MKLTKVRVINEWYEIDGFIHIDFMMDKDYHNLDYTDSHARILNVDIDEFRQYIDGMGLLETTQDRWDYGSESHYTIDSVMDFDEWMDNYMDDQIVRQYVLDYMKEGNTPDLMVLD